MSNPWMRTGAFLGGAVVLVVLALTTRPGGADPEFFSEEGEPFFPAFTDPDQATTLEIVSLDESGTAIDTFVVEKKDGKWTIPSHYGYPADAEDRMGKAAALFVGLRKQAVRSDSPADHVGFGVVDPQDESPESAGRGQRVSFKDSAGNVLASLIVGKKAERDGSEQQARFVRIPGSKRVYTAQLAEELSTAFSDWIETDLLGLQSWDVEKLVFDNHSVDETRGVVVPGDRLDLVKKEYKWTLEGLAEGEEFTEDKVRDATAELGRIKIVGVRTKPEGLTGRLETARGFEAQQLVDILMARGFYPVRSGAIKSDEGELVAVTNKGVRYTLRFGQVVYGTAREVSSGADGESGAAGEGAEGSGELKPNRYLMVTVDFDETAIPAPEQPAPAEEFLAKRRAMRDGLRQVLSALERYRDGHEDRFPAELSALSEGSEPLLAEIPKDPWGHEFRYTYDEGTNTYVLLALGEDGTEGGDGAAEDLNSNRLDTVDELEKLASDWQEVERKREEGRKEVEKLERRFEPWYYVIDASSYDKLKVHRADVVKAPEAGPPLPLGGESGGGEAGGGETGGGESGGGEAGAREGGGGGDGPGSEGSGSNG